MELPHEVPVMTLPNAILFPQALLPLYIFEPRYRRMLSDALETHRMFTVAMQKPGRNREAPSRVAGLGLIRASVARSDGTSNLILQGLVRVELSSAIRYKPYRIHPIRPLKTEAGNPVAADALTVKVIELVAECLKHGVHLPFHVLRELGHAEEDAPATPEAALQQGLELLSKINNPEQITDLVSCTLLTNPFERQILLETLDLEERLKHLIHFLMAEIRRRTNDPAS